MSNSETVAGNETPAVHLVKRRLLPSSSTQAFLIATVGAMLVFAQYHFWEQPCVGDRANWDYFSQVIARGGVPYRDVVNIKSPFSAYIGAVMILAGKLVGVRDVIAIRFAFLVLMSLVVGCTLLVATRYYDNLTAGFIAAAVMLCFHIFVRLNTGGVQPKTPMVLFGLITLWAVAEDRPITAGVCGMLSALSWQPGLLFVVVAVLTFSKYLTSWRDLKALKVVFAALLPLGILIFYLWAVGALGDFYRWTLHFNATVYGPNELRTISGSIRRLRRIIDSDYHASKLFFYTALPGLIISIISEWKYARGKGFRFFIQSAGRHSLIIVAVGYLGFCMIDLQGGADLIPLLPFIAIFAAAFLVLLPGVLVGASAKLSAQRKRMIEAWGLIAILTGIVLLGIINGLLYRVGFPKLSDQDTEVAAIIANLSPGDTIFVHGQTEVLVLSGLNNGSKYFLLDRGKDQYLDQVEPGGFEGWLERLKAKEPKIVMIDRLTRVERRAALLSLVRDYEAHEGRLFTYYLRRSKE